MPWVSIKGRKYFRLSQRVDGKVRNVHVGRGPDAERVAGLDAAARAVRDRARREDRDATDALLVGAHAVQAADKALAGVFAAVAYRSGLHLHHRQWRRKRGPHVTPAEPSTAAGEQLERLRAAGGTPLMPLDLSGIPEADRAVLAAAARGDPQALAAAGPYLSDPRFADRWGNPVHAARLWLIVQASGGDPLAARATDVQARMMATELGWDGAGLLEKVAITRVVHGWLAVSVLEARTGQRDPGSRERVAAERALTQADRRLQSAVRTLAYLRRVASADMAEQVRTAGESEGEGVPAVGE